MQVFRGSDPFARMRDALEEARNALRLPPAEIQQPLSEALERLSSAVDDLNDLDARWSREMAWLDERLLRIEHSSLFRWWKRIAPTVSRFRKNTRPASSDDDDYVIWCNHEEAALPAPDRIRAEALSWSERPQISFVLVAGSSALTNATRLSVETQLYPDWELCVAVRPSAWIAGDRIRTIEIPNDLDPVSAMNRAMSLATGRYVSLLEEGDRLSPHAAWFLACAGGLSADLIYTDEDEMDGAGRRRRPIFKPDWSPDLLRVAAYTGRAITFRRMLLSELGPLESEPGGAAIHRLLLRLADSPHRRVVHVPHVLYHRRIDSPPPARVPMVSRPHGPVLETTAVICSRNPALLARCVESVRATARGAVAEIIVVCHEDAGPNDELRAAAARGGAAAIPYRGVFNFSRMNNLGAAAATAPVLLFLNDDVVATEPGWAEQLSAALDDGRIGSVGALLRYPSGQIQHAGIVCGIGDGTGHVGRGCAKSDLWPWLLLRRNVSAVTGACLAIRRNLFTSLGGFDESFPNNYNDVDLCLRVRERGLEVICVPVEGLIHAECQSRAGVVRFEERRRFRTRWEHVLNRPDPYYSRALIPDERIALNLAAEAIPTRPRWR